VTMPRIKLQTAWCRVVVRTALATAPPIIPIRHRRKIEFIKGIPSESSWKIIHESEKLSAAI
jgi:hypothetical protein